MKDEATSTRTKREPQKHRTIDRVTRIIEEVVYQPGMNLAELVRLLDAPKSSIYGFVQGLLASGWLYEANNRFYLGPTVHSLSLASGHIRAGYVTHADLVSLNKATGVAVFLGVQAGDHLIYIAQEGTDPVVDFAARSNIRRSLLNTAGGKVLLAAKSDADRTLYLRRCGDDQQQLISTFLAELQGIQRTRIAKNLKETRFAIATTVNNQSGGAVASVTLVGAAEEIQPRAEELGKLLVQRVNTWSKRKISAREAI